MSAASNDFPERRRLSNVTFSTISPEVLLVKIRKVSSEVKEEDIPKMSSAVQPIKKNRSKKRDSNHSKFTMTDNQKTASMSSQTAQSEQVASTSKTSSDSDYTPCLKHAAENIGRKAAEVPSEKISLCNNCSKSMLSYIFLVQDFLDSLAKEINGGEASQCLQCVRQEVRHSIATSTANVDSPKIGYSSQIHVDHKSSSRSEKNASIRTPRGKSHRQEPNQNEYNQRVDHSLPHELTSHKQQTDFIYNVSTPSNIGQDAKAQITSNVSHENQQYNLQNNQQHNFDRQSTDQPQTHSNIAGFGAQKEGGTWKDESQRFVSGDLQHSPNDEQSKSETKFRSPMERVQPHYPAAAPTSTDGNSYHGPNNFVDSPRVYREGVDGIVSALSNAEREVYDIARNKAGWESLTEPQEKLVMPPGNVITTEAFVTSCRNNAEAIGCLVVGTSLLLCRTSRTLCVLVSDGVSTAFRSAFSSVFHVVQLVRGLDSLGSTKLALLEQPELGISFEKLNIWRLVQFSKCVYLNPDTLAIQNCDELFTRDELSAVPDIGWPDCFNSGVFVFSPSIQTFWKLLEFSEKQGSYDGGDQGLLNSYFNSWSSDISKKLSFIYNLMANVSYTYTPAFRQFGRDVKIVQFHGSFKPWHVKFFSNTGQISPSSPVHPTYVQFVHIWINIFRITVLRLLSKEIQNYASSQETISAVETLRFFPLPSESESDFFLTPPSVRLRLAEKKLDRSTSLPISEARRRKSAEYSRYVSPEDGEPELTQSQKEKPSGSDIVEESKPVTVVSDVETRKEKLEDTISEPDEVLKEGKVTNAKKEKVVDENSLPGAEVGDYQGMKAWEQGRMDYEGSDRSDNVIKRLQFLMSSRPK